MKHDCKTIQSQKRACSIKFTFRSTWAVKDNQLLLNPYSQVANCWGGGRSEKALDTLEEMLLKCLKCNVGGGGGWKHGNIGRN